MYFARGAENKKCLNKSIKLIFNYLLAPVLFILLTFSLYRQVIQQPDLDTRWQQVLHSVNEPGLWLAALLMLLNYGIEAWKWKLLLRPLESTGLKRSLASVFAGCSVTMLTPNRIGEFGGRILFVKEHNRPEAISLTILGSLSQLMITMLAGIAGLIWLDFSDIDTGRFSWVTGNFLLPASVVFTLLLLFVYFRVGIVISVIERITILKSFVKYIRVVRTFPGKLLLRILWLSFLRYMVFILQYMLILHVMGVHIPAVLSFYLLAVFYLVLAVAPTFGFIELPLRAAASLELLGSFSDNIVGIQSAAFVVWIINLVIPAIIGSLLIFGIKIIKEK